MYNEPITITVINGVYKMQSLLLLLTISVISTLAPLEIKSCAIRVCPLRQAQCRGVSLAC